MHHSKYDYIKKAVKAGMPVLLEGTAGTGKSTIAKQVAEDLNLKFTSISCTKQMSVNSLLGFFSINGAYLGTQFRDAFENGGLFLLDEIDAADPNVLLTLNTIENGYVSFPNGVITKHPDFRLIATANPSNEHSIYTGRSKLDFSTKDRFFSILVERDESLEASLVGEEVKEIVTISRELLLANGVSSPVTMRDSIRIKNLIDLKLTEDPYYDVIFVHNPDLYHKFQTEKENAETKRRKASLPQNEAASVTELWRILERESDQNKGTP